MVVEDPAAGACILARVIALTQSQYKPLINP
jgi:hypothetical protein